MAFNRLIQFIPIVHNLYPSAFKITIKKTSIFIQNLGLYDLSGIPVDKRIGEHSPKIHVESIMSRLDVNKDNVISLNEFVDGCVNDSTIKQFLLEPLFK